MRLFVGIELCEGMRRAAAEAAAALRRSVPGRYADPSLYHITLEFLGELTASEAEAAAGAMRAAAAGQAPFAMTLGAPGFFGALAGAVLWCGVRDDGTLDKLDARLRAELRKAGLPAGAEPFRAHVTLARQADLRAADLKLPVPGAGCESEALTLFQSLREGGKLRYLPLARAALRG